MALLLTDKIANIISQNDIIKKLVDDTNKIIEIANISNDSTQLNNAKIVRDNAIRVIQNNEDKIIKITKQITRITVYITIFSTIISILTKLPIPTAVPPGIGIPINVITKIVMILEKANKIVLALSSLIPTIIVSLEKAISILEEYKAQLLDINGLLDSKLAPIIVDDISFGTDFPEYKGFKFALREENNPKFVVRGNKRHYAVAINKSNVDILKSEFSFTLDPNDLIEQLKLIIDQKNLYGGETSDSTDPNNIQQFINDGSSENINELILNIQQAQTQQIQQAALSQNISTSSQTIQTTNPPLTSQQKKHYFLISVNPLRSRTERQRAKAILKRNYV